VIARLDEAGHMNRSESDVSIVSLGSDSEIGYDTLSSYMNTLNLTLLETLDSLGGNTKFV
jgi:hypothetical protein